MTLQDQLALPLSRRSRPDPRGVIPTTADQLLQYRRICQRADVEGMSDQAVYGVGFEAFKGMQENEGGVSAGCQQI